MARTARPKQDQNLCIGKNVLPDATGAGGALPSTNWENIISHTTTVVATKKNSIPVATAEAGTRGLDPILTCAVQLPNPVPLFIETIRGTVWSTLGQKWLAQCSRFSGLAIAPNRFQIIELARTTNKWKCSSTATYWAATMCARKMLGLPKVAADTKTTNYLEHLSNTELHCYAMSLNDAYFLEIWFLRIPEGLIICVAYLLGQRVSDMAQLAPGDLTLEFQNTTICITVRRGKVIQYIRPYVLHLSSQCPVAQALWHLRSVRQHHAFLFSETNSMKERTKLGTKIRNILKTIHPDLEQRSIRRGGLERMATHDVPLQTIQENFSKHTTIEMLLGYLRHGAVSSHQAQVQLAVTSWTMSQQL